MSLSASAAKFQSLCARATFAASLLMLIAAPAAAASFAYSDFSSVAGLTTNGSAAQAGPALRLVPSQDTQAGTAFRSDAVALDGATGFSTSFEFLVKTDPGSALGPPDGFSFLLQNIGPDALGAAGQGLGYVGLAPSVAVVFRGRDPSFIGAISGGVDPADLAVPFNPPGATSFAEGAFYETNQFAWIDYTPGSLTVYLATNAVKPVSPVMSASVNLFNTLGTQAYVGFSAGNGGAYGSQDILNWSFMSAPVPEPSTVWLLAAGLALVLARRVAKR